VRAILTYHSIDDSGSPISVSRASFVAHGRFLQSGRVRVVPLETIVGLNDEVDAVAITFDDGFANVWECLPVLEGLPATIFVVSDHVGAHNDWGGKRSSGIPHLPLLNWDQLAACQDLGLTIGAHSRRHPDLTRVSDSQLTDELDGCLDRLQEVLGERPGTFAYPFGAHNARVVSEVRERFRVACGTRLSRLAAHDEHCLLPRFDMYYLRDAGQLEAWGTHAFRTRLGWRSLLRQARSGLMHRALT
jgi:peptidoglycan/xylan/chitin deacetylase (PgdA/CDA1 family)